MGELRIEEDVPLAGRTTLRVGGAARWLCRVEREEELAEAAVWAQAAGVETFVLGGGSNLLVADAGFDGLVVEVAIGAPDGLRVERAGGSSAGGPVMFDVAAGVEWEALVRQAGAEGCSGVECLAGIPGTVGGSPVQNIGAYGQEVSQTIRSVRVFDRERSEMREMSAEECGFGYRRSVFNTSARGRYVVCRVRFELTEGGRAEMTYADLRRRFGEGARPQPVEVSAAVREIRRAKGMLLRAGDAEGEDGDFRSAGSFFKNPVVEAEEVERIAAAAGCGVGEVPQYPAGEAGRVKVSAAWLMERAGFRRGFAMGRAGLSTRHVLALVNRGGASAAEIVALRDAVVDGVGERFGVGLEQEPVMVGF